MENKNFQHGDIVLFGGAKGIVSNLIKFFDNATYTHVGLVYYLENNPWCLDMWFNGSELVPLSKRIKIYSKIKILRPEIEKEEIDFYLKTILDDLSILGHYPYDYGLLPRIAISKKLKIDFINWGRAASWTCSEFVQMKYTNKFTDLYRGISLITPEDFNRYYLPGHKIKMIE